MADKIKQIKPQLPRGMRDYLPETMLNRQAVFRDLQTIFEKYGYVPIETPAIERLDVLTGKYGEESDRLIFKILKRGAVSGHLEDELTDLGLRYDLTVPLSRFISLHNQKIKMPFKRYQMQPVWRAEKPQRGRFREFYQCDIDIIGVEDLAADAEIMAISYEILSHFGLPNFKVHFNHRKILMGMAEVLGIQKEQANLFFTTLDKMDKIGFEGVKEEMAVKEIPRDAIDGLASFTEISGTPLSIFPRLGQLLGGSDTGMKGIEETNRLYDLTRALAVPDESLCFDIFLARGLEYYTGPIFESMIKNPPIGSLTGGGRYDELIGMFLGEGIPATGTSIGIERILTVLEELDLMPERISQADVLIAYSNSALQSEAMQLGAKLRHEGIPAEIYLAPVRLKKQLKYADARRIPIVLILGEEEWLSRRVILKDMFQKTQEQVAEKDLSERILKALNQMGRPRDSK